jgi:tetratricopeptide (TPR) repeat protein
MRSFLIRRIAENRFPIAFLALSVLVVYANSLPSDFVWDDFAVVVARIETSGIADIPNLFLRPDSIGTIGAPYYRPLNLSTYLVDAFLYGNQAVGFHLTNVVLHALAVVALYLVSLELLGRRDAALLAALLLAVHPINTEAVNFISARNSILATLFVLSALLFYLEHARSRIPRLLYLAAALFLLGLFSKETAAMLLVVLVVWERFAWNREKSLAALASRLWPFAVSIAIYLTLRTIALSGSLGLELDPEGLGSRLSPNLAIVPKYLGLVFWPVDLSAVRMPPAGGFPISPWTYAAWVGIAGGIALLWWTGRPGTRLGLLWFAVNYLPISNLVFTPSAPMAERFLYLPAIGIWWIAADQVSWASERASARPFVRVAAGAALIALACVSAIRNLDWRSSVSLFEHEVRNDPSVSDHHYNLCTAYFDAGELSRAEAECVRADELGPGNPDLLTQLGNLQQAQGRYAQALDYYQRAVAAAPSHLKARYNLARLLENLGRPDIALSHYLVLQRILPADHALAAEVRSRIRGIAARAHP